MKVIQVNAEDQGGGAAKIAYQVYRSCLKEGFDTKFIVGRKNKKEENIHLLSNDYGTPKQQFIGKIDKYFAKVFGSVRGSFIIRDYLHLLANPEAISARKKNRMDNFYSGTEKIFEQVGFRPDILHLHNLHGKYFDLTALPQLSSDVSVIWTLHDEWAYTEVGGYLTEFDNAPIEKITSSPDSIHYNLKVKKEVYSKSSLIVCTPSKWLYERAKSSILNAKAIYHIPNGVDINTFRPQVKERVRRKLKLPSDEIIILFTANKGSKSKWKDYPTVISSAKKIAEKLKPKKIRLINPGNSDTVEKYENLTVQSLPYLSSEEEIAQYYQVADLYLHAANAENLPLAILEAMACGIPTVATNVGGIPEIIEDGESGFLVERSNPKEMSDRAIKILKDDNLHSKISKRSREIITEKYSLEIMIDRYLELYASVQKDREVAI